LVDVYGMVRAPVRKGPMALCPGRSNGRQLDVAVTVTAARRPGNLE
jgi:hypothetical protein